LARAVLAEQFGISGLPDYGECYANAKDQKSVSLAVEAGLASGWLKVTTPAPGDLVILRLAGRPWHCAVAVGGDWMLHVVEGVNTVVEQFSRPLWKNRIEGFFR
jgi:cell wall-associated NlpC family hydrolase